jgi:glycosyltransferase involved in cell wall biosynthesis
MRELALHGRYTYQFWGSLDAFHGIKAFKGDDTVSIRLLQVRETKVAYELSGYSAMMADKQVRAVIVIGNPNILSTWWIALRSKFLGKKVLFWTHGWLKREPILKRTLRNLYFGLADRVLCYGERARSLAKDMGFNESRVVPVYNSLDFTSATLLYDRLQSGFLPKVKPQELFHNSALPLIICTARLIRQCRFDLLFDAAAILAGLGRPINILLIGDGEAREELTRQASELALNVVFYGACYDEETVGSMIYLSDLTVSPGKIGLTVIHSLSYGTPAITHDNLDQQMPEVEAIVTDETGLLFKYESSENLAEAIDNWLHRAMDRGRVRSACRAVIEQKWNPKRQRIEIEKALDEILENSR